MYDRILFPINCSNNHWCLAEINMQKQNSNKADLEIKSFSFYLYDSMKEPAKNANNDSVLCILKDYVLFELEKKLDVEKIEEKLAKINYEGLINKATFEIKEVPRQTNMYDCGIFTCMFIKYIAGIQDFVFSQDNMIKMRLEMKEIIKGIRKNPLTFQIKELI